jgi:membrane-associated protease RseP (regulator of RpoE activity)
VGNTFQEFGEVSIESVTQLGAFFTPSSLGDFFSRVVQPETTTGEGDQVVTGEGTDDEGRILSIYGAARLGTSLTDRGVADLFQFLIILNIFIGIFNLVPLLPLDGGHVAVAVYERIRSIGGQRYYADVSKLLPMVYAVVFVLISVGLAALYLDITDPII